MPAWQGGCRICHKRRQQKDWERKWDREYYFTKLKEGNNCFVQECCVLVFEFAKNFTFLSSWLPVVVHFKPWILKHNLYWHSQNISNYISLQGSSGKKTFWVCECAAAHACVTLCVGGCTCVFIKKYQLFWSVAHHSSHSPLSCTHLTRPQEKNG